ncbi:MAG: membrane-bound O-acyltransferase family protein, partial [Acidobacteria bacterium]|nr:membrane-bound O-acyltransferase family protein [Acidobacteriota bacterium]
RDYLYVPLGGNRKGPRRTYVNLAIVMLLGGLWHGASWNFVLWGAIHGALLALERAVGVERLWGRLPGAARTAAVFLIATLAWVPFRAADFAATAEYFGRLVGWSAAPATATLLPGLVASPYLLLSFAAAAGVTWLGAPSWSWTRTLSPARAAVAMGLLALATAALATQKFNPFIYFIF